MNAETQPAEVGPVEHIVRTTRQSKGCAQPLMQLWGKDMTLPPLPKTHYMLYTPSDGYSNDHLTSWDGWDDEAMRSYAEAAVLEERERWRQAAEVMAQEADRKFPMDGTVAHWLRALVAKRGQ